MATVGAESPDERGADGEARRPDEARSAAAQVLGDDADSAGHPTWCEFDRPGVLGGVEHTSVLFEWRPTYMSDVAVTGWLRRVCYSDSSEETPVVVLQVDNPEQPGEIGMTTEDLASLVERLLVLRRTLPRVSLRGPLVSQRERETRPRDGVLGAQTPARINHRNAKAGHT